MAIVVQEFDATAALLGLYNDLPYVKKVGYSIGEMEGRILIRVLFDPCEPDEYHDRAMNLVERADRFRRMLPAGMRNKYHVIPMVSDPDEGSLRHFYNITRVIDR